MPPIGPQGTQTPGEFANQNPIQTDTTPGTPPAPAGMPDTQTAPDVMNASIVQNNMLGNSPDGLPYGAGFGDETQQPAIPPAESTFTNETLTPGELAYRDGAQKWWDSLTDLERDIMRSIVNGGNNTPNMQGAIK